MSFGPRALNLALASLVMVSACAHQNPVPPPPPPPPPPPSPNVDVTATISGSSPNYTWTFTAIPNVVDSDGTFHFDQFGKNIPVTITLVGPPGTNTKWATPIGTAIVGRVPQGVTTCDTVNKNNSDPDANKDQFKSPKRDSDILIDFKYFNKNKKQNGDVMPCNPYSLDATVDGNDAPLDPIIHNGNNQ
jgi:hypothetical protein